ncbi:MAG: hypothetical protein K1X28_02995 [Parachlamydiales bacterium]|nr:hypothetical protein [Parachlamydiales bacterium]
MVATKEETTSKSAKGLKEVEEVIAKAIKKLGAKKENELCKYLPMKSGGYMHHFTLRKMKYKQPQELSAIIERFVINADRPVVIAPKQRAARGSRKRKDHLNFTRVQLERMLNIARLAGDKEIITILSPRKSLASCKRELIQAIRHNKVESELWANYCEAIQAQQMMSEALAAAGAQN